MRVCGRYRGGSFGGRTGGEYGGERRGGGQHRSGAAGRYAVMDADEFLNGGSAYREMTFAE